MPPHQLGLAPPTAGNLESQREHGQSAARVLLGSLVPLICLGVALAVVAAVAIANRVSNRRRKVYEAFDLERGYRFEPERPGEEARHVGTCRVFSEGHRRTWGFTIAGASGGTPLTARSLSFSSSGPTKFVIPRECTAGSDSPWSLSVGRHARIPCLLRIRLAPFWPPGFCVHHVALEGSRTAPTSKPPACATINLDGVRC